MVQGNFDENGWLIGDVAPYSTTAAYSLLAPDASTMLNGERLRRQAAKFFRFELSLVSAKRYPGGGWPRSDRAWLSLTYQGTQHRVEVVTMPLDRAPDVREVAAATAARVGAGFDVLVGRAVRLWQVPGAGDDVAPLAVTAVLASLLLAPVLPPEGDAIFGVKTARERLEKLGMRT